MTAPFLNGAVIDNDSYVDVDDIGQGDNALFCNTDKNDCCDRAHGRAGEWYFPNRTQVQTEGVARAISSSSYFFRNRGQRVIRLNRVNNPLERGRFQCEVPNAEEEMQTLHINIGKW